MSKKATLADIIARKKQGDLDRLQIKHYKSETLGVEIEIKKIPLKKYMDLVGAVDEGNTEGEYIDAINKLIYECCPMFRENTKEAMEVYKVAEPTDLPSAVLEDQLNEMKEIMEVINSFYGIDKIEGKIKN